MELSATSQTSVSDLPETYRGGDVVRLLCRNANHRESSCLDLGVSHRLLIKSIRLTSLDQPGISQTVYFSSFPVWIRGWCDLRPFRQVENVFIAISEQAFLLKMDFSSRFRHPFARDPVGFLTLVTP